MRTACSHGGLLAADVTLIKLKTLLAETDRTTRDRRLDKRGAQRDINDQSSPVML